MTNRPEIFDRSVMMSSVMPSAKYSCSGSPLMLVNGSTAIDGFSLAGTASAAPERLRRAAGARRGATLIDPHRPLDVLQRLLAHVLEGEVEPVADMVAHRAGDGDAARPGDALEPRRDVDAVAEDVVALDDDVAEIDADAELDAAVLRHVGVALAHPALDLGGAGDGVHDARELDQHAVAGELDDAALMLGDLGVDQLVADAPSAPPACRPRRAPMRRL